MDHHLIKILRLNFIISLLFLMPHLQAEITVVNGQVSNGAGMTIRLMTYNDQVSYQRVTLASTTVSDDNHFSLSTDISSVLYCWLDLEFQNADIFLQPGQKYDVELELNDYSLASSYYNRTGIPIRFIEDDDDQLNISIRDFNQLYNEFLLDYAENMRSLNPKVAYETFVNAIELRFQQNQNSYLKDYMFYKLASLQLYMRTKNNESIGMEFFTGRPILYENPEYMDFFHLYFEKYFITRGKYFDFNKSYDLINRGARAAELLDSLADNPVLDDLALRELLLLTGLKELYFISGFQKSKISDLIKEMANGSANDKTRLLASNLLIRLTRLQPGSMAPVFTLEGISETGRYSLPGFKGKYVYLAFFDSSTPASQAELGLVSDFYDKYQQKVAFVAISVDKNMPALLDYLKRAELPWVVLHYGGNLQLLEDYDASTFPYFLLIDDKGKILRCPAPSPSENIPKVFDSF